MREIVAGLVTEAVAGLFRQANYELPEDVLAALRQAREREVSPPGREVLDRILENADIAAGERIPLCQDWDKVEKEALMAKVSIEGVGGYSYHYPRLAAIITVHARDKDNAMAAAWHCPLSFKPTLYGVSISPRRFTHDLIMEAGEFGVNFMPMEKAELIASVGGSSGREVDKFQRFQMAKEKPLKTSAPLIAEAYACYECRLVAHQT